MRSKDPSTIKKDRLAKRGLLKLPKPTRKAGDSYIVKVLEDSDQRLQIVRMIRNRIKQLEDECGAESLAKQMLCARAVWLWCYLETLEVEAIETGEFKAGPWVQANNSLVGI